MKMLIDAIENKDYEALAAIAGNMLGVRITKVVEFMNECRKARNRAIEKSGYELGAGHTLCNDWSEDSYRAWIKNRYIEVHGYQVGNKSWEGCRLNELHTGFVYIWETPEQIERLKWFDASESPFPSIARSRITDALIQIRSVDRVANRVAQMSGIDI